MILVRKRTQTVNEVQRLFLLVACVYGTSNHSFVSDFIRGRSAGIGIAAGL